MILWKTEADEDASGSTKKGKEGLEGVKFTVWKKTAAEDEGEQEVKEHTEDYVTDREGRIVLKYLTPGIYCVRETESIPGYLRDDAVWEFAVEKTGKVVLTDNKVDSETGSLTLWAQFENPDRMLVPGGYATVLLSSALNKPLPAVRLSAVMTTAEGNLVYVLGADNKVIARPVVLGPVINNMQTIEKGISVGETIVVDGTHKARPGSVVAPVPAK